jgi:hypothetical protein
MELWDQITGFIRVKKQAGCLFHGAFVNLVYPNRAAASEFFLQTDSWNPGLHSAAVTPYTRFNTGSLLSSLQNKRYAAKLTRVASRPIENDPNAPLRLIRLEFAIYWMAEEQKLESQGEIACRDLVVRKLLPANRDACLVAHTYALRGQSPIDEPENWIRLEGCGRWIALKLGPRDAEGGRNPFKETGPVDPSA